MLARRLTVALFLLLYQVAPLSWSRAQESHTAKLIDAQIFGP